MSGSPPGQLDVGAGLAPSESTQTAIRRAQFILKLLTPAVVLLAILSTPIFWLRGRGPLRDAYGRALVAFMSIAVAIGLLANLRRIAAGAHSERERVQSMSTELPKAPAEAAYEPNFPGTVLPRRTPFEPGGEGLAFIYMTNRYISWTYLLERLPTRNELEQPPMPKFLDYGYTQLWVMEKHASFRGDSPKRWPMMPEAREPGEAAAPANGDYVVFADPQFAQGRTSHYLTATPDPESAMHIAAIIAKTDGISTCVARLLENHFWH